MSDISFRNAAGFFLVLTAVVMLPGLLMFWARAGHKGGKPRSRAQTVPGWVGWASILWNLAWLVAIPLISPKDIYFPVLHSVVPLLIGIVLIGSSSRRSSFYGGQFL